jgi:hypothetical protein
MNMAIRTARWAALALVGGLTVGALAQPGGPTSFNERVVDRQPTPEDKSGIWVLDFHFKDPRVVTVDLPARGRKLVWYLWYQVANATGEPRTFLPRFVWVCHDENTVHLDQHLAKAQAVIQRLEDPAGLLDIKNSVTIFREPLPVSKEFDDKGNRIAYPKLTTGVAMWDDINPKSTYFSIYVYGLSDGWSAVDGPDGKPIVKYKTLQLKFKRLGDEFNQASNQIRFLGSEWIYATQELPEPLGKEDKKGLQGVEKKEDKKPAAPPSGQNTGKPVK